MSALVATACFRRSDNKEMVRTGEPLYNVSDGYAKELIRVGIARECAVKMAAPETKEVNFPSTVASPPSALPPVQVLPQTIAKPLENGEKPKLKKKPGRKKKPSLS